MRILQHQSHIRLKVEEVLLVEHFLRAGHKENEFTFTVLHVGKSGGQELRMKFLKKEEFW